MQAAARYLTYLRDIGCDPFLWALAEAPIDDEPETEEERAAVAEAREAAARRQVVAWSEVRTRFVQDE